MRATGPVLEEVLEMRFAAGAAPRSGRVVPIWVRGSDAPVTDFSRHRYVVRSS